MTSACNRNLSEGIGVEDLLSIGLLESLIPEFGAEPKDISLFPVGEKNKEISDIGPGLDLVECTGSDQRIEGAVPLPAIFAAKEEPIFGADFFMSELEFRKIIMRPETRVSR